MNVEEQVRNALHQRAERVDVVDRLFEIERGVRRRRRRALVVPAGVLLAAAGVVVALMARVPEREVQRVVMPSSTSAPARGLLPEPTDAVLIIAADDNLTLVDVDSGKRRIVDRDVRGAIAFPSFTLAGGAIVMESVEQVRDDETRLVAWVWQRGYVGSPTRLGEGIAIRSADPARVWLMKVSGLADTFPGGAVTEVDLGGRVTAGPFSFPPGTEPMAFLGGNLALFQSADGPNALSLAVKDVSSGAAVRRIPGRVLAVTDDRLAWVECGTTCSVHLEDLDDDTFTRVVQLPEGAEPDGGTRAQWSPDGERLALILESGDGEGRAADRRIVVIGEAGALEVEGSADAQNLGWSHSGEWLFFTTGDYLMGDVAFNAVMRDQRTARPLDGLVFPEYTGPDTRRTGSGVEFIVG